MNIIFLMFLESLSVSGNEFNGYLVLNKGAVTCLGFAQSRDQQGFKGSHAVTIGAVMQEQSCSHFNAIRLS